MSGTETPHLEHAEDLAFQEHCVALFQKLAADVADVHRETFELFLDFARRHRDVINASDVFATATNAWNASACAKNSGF